MIQRKLKTLATQRAKAKVEAQLSSCIHFVNESIITRSWGEVIKMKTTIVKQVTELTTPFQNTEADVAFSSSLDITAECRKYMVLY